MEQLLPSPQDASPSLPVPLVSGFQYTYGLGDFEKLAGVEWVQPDGSRSTITLTEALALDTAPRASLIQSWLFFGLFSAFVGRPVRQDLFLQADSTQPSGYNVSANPIAVADVFKGWTKAFEELSSAKRDEVLISQLHLLDFAAAQCDHFDVFDENAFTDRADRDFNLDLDVQVLSLVLLSVRLLIAYLRSSTEILARKSRIGDAVHNVLRILDTSRQTKKNEWGKVFVPIPPGGQVPLSALPLMKQFQISNWCPIRARRLCELYDFTLINYLSRVPRMDSQNATHSHCYGLARCKAYDIEAADMAKYQPKHVGNNCDCNPVQIKKDVLTKAIMDGEIPILSIDPRADDLDLKLHHYDGIMPYTAISHVWSDGRGNPHKNSLPLCQLRRIAKVLTNIKDQHLRYISFMEKMSGFRLSLGIKPKRVYFWMDTLCVPVEIPEDCHLSIHEVKRQAIRNITPVFEAAEQVLVLDSELEKLPLRSPEDEEMTQAEIDRDEETLTAKVLGSKWLQRAWTLEEGSLSSDCHFKVAGETATINLGELVPASEVHTSWSRDRKRRAYWKKHKKELKKHQDDDIEAGSKTLLMQPQSLNESRVRFETPLKLLLAGPLNEKRKQATRMGKGGSDAKRFLTTRAMQFCEAWNDLLDRSATKPHDALIVLADILDFNSSTIDRIQPHQQRLPTMIRNSHELPLGLLFNTASTDENRDSPRDSWIPTAVDGDRLVGEAIMSRRKNDGCLFVDYSARPDTLHAFVVWPKIPFDEPCVTVEVVSAEGSGKQYVIEICTPMEDSETVYLDDKIKGPYSLSWAQQRQASYRDGDPQSCLIMIDTATGSSSANGYTARGARFSIVGSSSGEMQVRYDTSITAWTWEQWMERPGKRPPPRYPVRCRPLEGIQVLSLDQEPVKPGDLVLSQRPLLKPHSLHSHLWREVITYLISTVITAGIVEIGYSRCTDSDQCQEIRAIVHFIVAIFVTLLTYYAWKWHRRHQFKKWLATFNAC